MKSTLWNRFLRLIMSANVIIGFTLSPIFAFADDGSALVAPSLSSVISNPVMRNVVGPTCTQNVTITSIANHDLVSTELGYTGSDYAMLRARATVKGPWEQYTICNFASDGYWTIQSQADGLYVSAELGYTGNQYGMLRARASVVGPWEKFSFGSCGVGCTTIQSQANGLYVSAELGYTGDQYGMLRARATVVGPWEQFR
ncbi:fascin domain-containing protein [Burkholderia oklahomensis]|nr:MULTISPECIES: hypothetical protein [pseudomallei group]QPS38717.1 hypothetical protein I6G57_07815 [Burkholderia oklahomensis]